MNSFRDSTKRILYRLVAARPDPSPRGRGAPVVVGFMRTPSGVGETARLMFDAFDRLGLEPGYVDLSHRFQPNTMLERFEHPASKSAGKGPLIIHANPADFAAVMTFLGRRLICDRYVIGYWAWELERLPKIWRTAEQYVHEIWVPSTFIANCAGPQCAKPVKVVPPPVVRHAVKPNRARFDLPANDFTFLAVADSRPSLERKNILGAIKAFKKVSQSKGNLRLALKIKDLQSLRASVRDELRREILDPSIQVIETFLSEREMACLISSVDAILSLHRSEGFGLVSAQAIMLGKPVIATDWSGSKDFLNAENSALVPMSLIAVNDPNGIYHDGRWAEPDIDVAAAQIAQLATDKSYRTAISQAAQRTAARFFDLQKWRETLEPDFLYGLCEPSSSELE